MAASSKPRCPGTLSTSLFLGPHLDHENMRWPAARGCETVWSRDKQKHRHWLP